MTTSSDRQRLFHPNPESVRELTAIFTSAWEGSTMARPEAVPSFSPDEQARHAATVEAALRLAGSRPPGQDQLAELRRTAQSMVISLLDMDSDECAMAMLDAFGNSGEQFVRKAQRFSAAISAEAVYQALRNLWIFNSLQAASCTQISCSPAGFAYSMLYPITDNILDDSTCSDGTKGRFGAFLTRRLAWTWASPITEMERQSDRLIRLIERQYPRSRFADVYDALLAIHCAQQRSLLLHSHPAPQDVLPISIEKGGTSVLADAFLVSGTLSPDAARFTFGLGALLQMIDDLQDREEDVRNGHATLFSTADSPAALEQATNRLLSFADVVLGHARWVPPWGPSLEKLFRRSCRCMILESVASMPERYSRSYYEHLACCSPVDFRYLSSLRLRCTELYHRSLAHGKSLLPISEAAPS